MPESVLLRYPCHLISTTYQALSHFHGDNTGSNPVGDANTINNLDELPIFAAGPKRSIKDFILPLEPSWN